jgi:ABC-2 type transport system permease protein
MTGTTLQSVTTARSSRFVELARLGVRLRWRLVRNRARRQGKKSQTLGIVAACLYGGLSIIGLWGVRFGSDQSALRTLTLQMSGIALAWIFGPILLGGVDETVDPTRLALLPLRTSELFCVQVAAALSGLAPLSAAAVLTIGVSLGFSPLTVGFFLPPLAGLCALVMVLGLARATAGALARAQRSRRGRDLGVLVAAFAGGGLFVVTQLAGQVDSDVAASIIDGLGWTPWGWCVRAAVAARDGRNVDAIGWLIPSIAMGAAAMWLWARLTVSMLQSSERSVHRTSRKKGPALRGATTELGASLARQWIYIRRSPSIRIGLLFGTVFGVAFPVLQILQNGVDGADGVVFGVLLAMLVNVGAVSNVLGFDAGSLWLEVQCGGPRRPQLIARSVAGLPNLLLPTWISAVVVGIWTSHGVQVLLVSLLAIPVALVVLAEGLMTSFLAAFPIADGDNPFGNRQAMQGRGMRLVLTSLGGLAAVAILSAPVVLAAYLGRHAWWGWVSVAVGVLWGLALYAMALRWVGRKVTGHEPELLAMLAPRALL